MNNNNQQIQPLTCHGHTRPVVDLQFSIGNTSGSDAGPLLISSCKDGKPIVRNGITGDWIGTYLGHKGAVWSSRLTKEGRTAITGSADFTAQVWDTSTGDMIHTFQHEHIVRAVDWDDKEGSQIATGGKENILRIFDLYRPSDSPSMMIPKAHQDTIRSIVWDKNKRHRILTASDDQYIHIWDLRTLQKLDSIACSHPVTSMTLSIDGSHLLWSSGNTAHFWDIDSADQQDIITHTLDKHVSSITLHPDHSKFAAGSDEDLWVRVYDFKSGEEKEVYKGHHGPIHTTSYSHDGEILATGSEDGTIRFWKTNPSTSYGLWK
ncbi:unnamed protein product [Cunninghamella echinulata]